MPLTGTSPEESDRKRQEYCILNQRAFSLTGEWLTPIKLTLY